MHTKVGEAIVLAVEAHDGQQDGAGQPYILHAMRVAAAGRTPYEIIVGALHDVVEDTCVTPEDIRELFGEQIALAVCSVSRRWFWGEEFYYKRPATGEHVYKESYNDFILRAAANPTGRVVKINDIKDNLARMTGLPRAKAIALTKRYTMALEKLKGASRPLRKCPHGIMIVKGETKARYCGICSPEHVAPASRPRPHQRLRRATQLDPDEHEQDLIEYFRQPLGRRLQEADFEE